jgi:hypothetical protein
MATAETQEVVIRIRSTNRDVLRAAADAATRAARAESAEDVEVSPIGDEDPFGRDVKLVQRGHELVLQVLRLRRRLGYGIFVSLVCGLGCLAQFIYLALVLPKTDAGWVPYLLLGFFAILVAVFGFAIFKARRAQALLILMAAEQLDALGQLISALQQRCGVMGSETAGNLAKAPVVPGLKEAAFELRLWPGHSARRQLYETAGVVSLVAGLGVTVLCGLLGLSPPWAALGFVVGFLVMSLLWSVVCAVTPEGSASP